MQCLKDMLLSIFLSFQFVFIEGAEVPAGRRPYKLKEALHLQSKSPTSTTGMRLSELCTYTFVFKGNSLELITIKHNQKVSLCIMSTLHMKNHTHRHISHNFIQNEILNSLSRFLVVI